ncbi:hypothetical protein J6590_046983 [Homalodisca vitripennis]|nr:hypothetical protein J6590_046983 [Homalodisca vitripennis]
MEFSQLLTLIKSEKAYEERDREGGDELDPEGITSGWFIPSSRTYHWTQEKPTCHLNLGNLMEVQERHITNRICPDSGVQGQFDRSSLLWEMTVGVDVLASLNKGVPPPSCFNWRGWFRAGLPFFRGDMALRLGP